MNRLLTPAELELFRRRMRGEFDPCTEAELKSRVAVEVGAIRKVCFATDEVTTALSDRMAFDALAAALTGG